MSSLLLSCWDPAQTIWKDLLSSWREITIQAFLKGVVPTTYCWSVSHCLALLSYALLGFYALHKIVSWNVQDLEACPDNPVILNPFRRNVPASIRNLQQLSNFEAWKVTLTKFFLHWISHASSFQCVAKFIHFSTLEPKNLKSWRQGAI